MATNTADSDYITEIQNLLSNSKVRNVIHSGRITFRVLTNYIPRSVLSTVRVRSIGF